MIYTNLLFLVVIEIYVYFVVERLLLGARPQPFGCLTVGKFEVSTVSKLSLHS